MCAFLNALLRMDFSYSFDFVLLGLFEFFFFFFDNSINTTMGKGGDLDSGYPY